MVFCSYEAIIAPCIRDFRLMAASRAGVCRSLVGRLVEPKKWEPLFLPTSRVLQTTGAPPGFPGATWNAWLLVRPLSALGLRCDDSQRTRTDTGWQVGWRTGKPVPTFPANLPPNVRCACVHISGFVGGSMEEGLGAGISIMETRRHFSRAPLPALMLR